VPVVQAWGNVKTRIIQNEPDPEPYAEVEEVAVADERQTWLRRACFLVAVVGYFIIGVIHPAEIAVGDDTTLYIGIHLVQPFFILLLAWGTWLLVKDLPGRAAQVARIAIVPYAIAYSMFDAIAGVALGGIVRLANDASAADAAAVQRLMDSGTDYVGMVLFAASDLSWFVMALAAAIAVKPIGGRGPTLLMAIGAAIFAIAHPFPPGPIGIALFGLGIAWLELRREAAKSPETAPAAVAS
jgi:uncharacterized membrane protein YccF (DUF307 family)